MVGILVSRQWRLNFSFGVKSRAFCRNLYMPVHDHRMRTKMKSLMARKFKQFMKRIWKGEKNHDTKGILAKNLLSYAMNARSLAI